MAVRRKLCWFCLLALVTVTAFALVFRLHLFHDADEVSIPSSQQHAREKRSVIAFAKMIQAVIPTRLATDYNGYGNYCGVGGSGEILDEIDRCCAWHDACYNRLSRVNGSCSSQQGVKKYLIGYTWKVVEKDAVRSVVCEPPSRNKTQAAAACGSGLCYCDQRIIGCWAKHEKSFNRALMQRRSIVSALLQYVKEFFEPPKVTDPFDTLTEMQWAKQASEIGPKEGEVKYDILDLGLEKGERPAVNNRTLTKVEAKLLTTPPPAGATTAAPPKFVPARAPQFRPVVQQQQQQPPIFGSVPAPAFFLGQQPDQVFSNNPFFGNNNNGFPSQPTPANFNPNGRPNFFNLNNNNNNNYPFGAIPQGVVQQQQPYYPQQFGGQQPGFSQFGR